MSNDFDFEHTCERQRNRCTEEVKPLRLLDNHLGNSREPYPASGITRAVSVDSDTRGLFVSQIQQSVKERQNDF